MSVFRTSIAYKTAALLLCFVFVIPPTAQAVEPRASYYLESYTSYICHMGGGDLEIWYRVTGTGTQAELGVLRIMLYESTDQVNWTWVETFQHYECDTMLAYDAWQHMSHVDYQGKLCKYYRAYVCIWGGDGTNGDARYFWTDVEYASLLNP